MGQVATIERSSRFPVWQEPSLDAKLVALLDRREAYSDLPVVGPATAAKLRAFAAAPQPGRATAEDIEKLLSLLDTALPRQAKTEIEADALAEQYCHALGDMPMDALRHAYQVILREDRWFPPVARIREAARGSRPSTYVLRRRVADMLLMKHEHEYRPPIVAVDPAEVRQLCSDIAKAKGPQMASAIASPRAPRRYCATCHISLDSPAVAGCRAPNCGKQAGAGPDFQPAAQAGT